MKKKFRDLKKSTTLGDLDDLASHITQAVLKALEEHPTKNDLKQEVERVEDKVDKLDQKVTSLDKKVDKLDYDVSDIRRRVIDFEVTDAPTRAEFTDLKHQLATHTR